MPTANEVADEVLRKLVDFRVPGYDGAPRSLWDADKQTVDIAARILNRLETSVIDGMYLGGPDTPDGQSLFALLAKAAGVNAADVKQAADAARQRNAPEVIHSMIATMPPAEASTLLADLDKEYAAAQQPTPVPPSEPTPPAPRPSQPGGRVNHEPLLTTGGITALVTAVIGVLVSLGLPLSSSQQQAVLGVVAVLAPIAVAVLARKKVTPTADPRDDQGLSLVVAAERAAGALVSAVIPKARTAAPAKTEKAEAHSGESGSTTA